ncbi:MAG: hypothetical protein H6Q14_60 [Bacteroidetes bacterium]|jgi:tRNA1Val (adenine37-N6)-methyltransferase|nr:hypothetical protein [Bacteroidota bacterium]
MSNPYFRFKEFTIYHDRCAMKVGTDGVLLGAWANVCEKTNILDVGAGSGLISLMLAQRDGLLQVDALEIDPAAAEQAQENVKNSRFEKQILVYNADFVHFAKKNVKKYDLIVSNPPFFKDSLRSPSTQRTAARHSDNLDAEDLIGLGATLLARNGTIALIYPIEFLETLLQIGEQSGLSPSRICKVFPKPEGTPKRVLIELSLGEKECEESELTIEIERHVYTDEFARLTHDFYLDK